MLFARKSLHMVTVFAALALLVAGMAVGARHAQASSYRQETIHVVAEKTWVDADNADQARPTMEEFKSWLRLIRIETALDDQGNPLLDENGSPVTKEEDLTDQVVIEVSESAEGDGYTAIFGGFSGRLYGQDDDGQAYSRDYVVREVMPEDSGYELTESSYRREVVDTGDSRDIRLITSLTNTLTTSIGVSKVWENGAAGSSAVIELTENDAPTGNTLTLTADQGWVGSFDGLPKYDAEGNEIIYGVREVLPEDSVWTPEVVADGAGGFVVTNTRVPDHASAWTDSDDSSPEDSSPTDGGASSSSGDSAQVDRPVDPGQKEASTSDTSSASTASGASSGDSATSSSPESSVKDSHQKAGIPKTADDTPTVTIAVLSSVGACAAACGIALGRRKRDAA